MNLRYNRKVRVATGIDNKIIIDFSPPVLIDWYFLSLVFMICILSFTGLVIFTSIYEECCINTITADLTMNLCYKISLLFIAVTCRCLFWPHKICVNIRITMINTLVRNTLSISVTLLILQKVISVIMKNKMVNIWNTKKNYVLTKVKK